jgi:hypothetical protein
MRTAERSVRGIYVGDSGRDLRVGIAQRDLAKGPNK